jgi:hypothetical protein
MRASISKVDQMRFQKSGTAEFGIDTDAVVRVPARPDVELDNLPPWRDNRFERFKTVSDLHLAKDRFLRSFSRGFDDSDYVSKERAYKWAAHQRYQTLFRPHARAWLLDRNSAGLRQAISEVYGLAMTAKDGPSQRLNLMYAPVEEPAYFDALAGDDVAFLAYVSAALDFIDSGDAATFAVFAESLTRLPTRKGGATLEHWTTLTWLPFIADPDRHYFLKPTVTQEFGSIINFDVRYRSELNFETYESSLRMAERLRGLLQDSELNLSRSALTLLDVQSFMWVVLRYKELRLTP